MLAERITEVAERYRGWRPEEIADSEGLGIIETGNMPRCFDDMLCLGTIVIPRDLAPEDRQWRIAHCLGHHFLHVGNQVWLKGRGLLPREKQEREADRLAACLMVNYAAPGLLDDLLRLRLSLTGIEEYSRQLVGSLVET